jgi:signal recognition particle receptor subunit beta
MAELDERQNRLTVKLVYYGPALSGKTSNLTCLHDLLTTELVGDMMMLETEGDRTLFFDLLPLGFTAPSGLLIKFTLYTVPGQVAHDGTRKAVLSRADGVVFVADSQRNQAVNNGVSFQNLVDNAGKVGIDAQHFPLVVQYNKRDLADIDSEDLISERWSKAPWPVMFASALQGVGVRETFARLLHGAYARLDAQYQLQTVHGVSEERFVSAAAGAA